MNRKLVLTFAIAVFMTAISCESSNNNKEANAQTTESPKEQSDKKITRTITGLVSAVQMGKDGYTAKLLMPTGEIISVTVSRVNLKDPQQYKEVKEQDILSVTGEQWEMEKEIQLTAREIH